MKINIIVRNLMKRNEQVVYNYLNRKHDTILVYYNLLQWGFYIWPNWSTQKSSFQIYVSGWAFSDSNGSFIYLYIVP